MLQDPRLIEIELLARLDLASYKGDGVTYIEPNPFGGEHRLVHEAWLNLVREMEITTLYPVPPGVVTNIPQVPDPSGDLKRAAFHLLKKLEGVSESVTCHITHSGRLRLWRLRAELDAGRILDPFGILVDRRHFETDFAVRRWMSAANEPCAVLFSDLDHFGKVNKVLGHDEGDRAIRLYRNIVRAIVAEVGGEAYERGGDEAVAILPNVDKDRAEELGNKICEAIKGEFGPFAEKVQAPLTASIGIVTFTRNVSALDARKEANEAMQAAKDKGKGRVVAREI